ncbi:MAG: transcription termination factor NusA [Candidatus Paceibacterota bacterium]
MDLKELAKIVRMLAEEKKIDEGKIIEVIEASLAAAYRKEYGHKGMAVKATLDLKTGEVNFKQTKTVVDETMVRIVEEGEEEQTETAPEEDGVLPRYNSDRHIFLEEAKKIKKDAKLEDEISFPLEAPKEEFGRIAAQTAKQNILQRLREVERESITDEFKGKEEAIISGTVRRFERGSVYVDLGRAEGVMFASESMPGEHYRIGERLKFFIIAVQSEGRGAGIILSRRHPKFISKLFETEVPEIADGTVEIKAIAREAGSRTKVAVFSNDESVDAVGSFVGQRGTRVMAVNNEIGQEKLDIIEWSENPEVFVTHALSPAKVSRVEMGDRREIVVFVPEDQLSLAIGRGGQNVRLAAKLTGLKIDVRSESNPEEKIEGGIAEAEEEV